MDFKEQLSKNLNSKLEDSSNLTVGLALKYVEKIYREDKPEVVDLVNKAIDIQNPTNPFTANKNFQANSQQEPLNQLSYQQKQNATEDVFSSIEALSQDDQKLFYDILARVSGLEQIIRKHGTSKLVDSVQGEEGVDANNLNYTVNKFFESGVSASQVESFINNVHVSVSHTAHPTDPTSLEHQLASMNLENAIDRNAPSQEADELLTRYFETPVTNDNLTVFDEIDIGTAILKNKIKAEANLVPEIYSALRQPHFEGAYDDIAITGSITFDATWYGSDADGNPYINAETFAYVDEKNQSMIKEVYNELLTDIALNIEANYPHLSQAVERTLAKLNSNEANSYISGINEGQSKSFVQDLNSLLQDEQVASNNELYGQILGLSHLAAKKGIRAAKPDTRLDSADLATSVAQIISISNADRDEEIPYPEKTLEERKAFLKEIINSPQIIEGLAQFDYTKAPQVSDDSKTGVRVNSLLKEIASRPEANDKLIIAQFKTEEDVYNAILQQQISGAGGLIVPLMETGDDLEEFQHVSRKLVNDDTFKAHVKDNAGTFVAMFALSDNTRVNGASASDNTKKAMMDFIKVSAEHNMPCRVFAGGGQITNRNMVRNVVETPKSVGYYFGRSNNDNFDGFHMTIQGSQRRLAFVPESRALDTITSMVSQSLFSMAATRNLLETTEVTNSGLNSAEAKRWQNIGRTEAVNFHREARENYEAYIEQPEAFDDLLEDMGLVFAKMANNSSRPNVRGKEGEIGFDTVPIKEFIGDKKARENRAITYDTTMRFSGLPHLGLLGQNEALQSYFEKVEDKYGANFAKDSGIETVLTRENMPEREHFLSMATSLYLSDFDKAWSIVGSARPEQDELEELSNKFKSGDKSRVNTLAFLDVYSNDLARNVFKVLKGDKALAQQEEKKGDKFVIQDLSTLIPEKATHIDLTRERNAFTDEASIKLIKQCATVKEEEGDISSTTVAIGKTMAASVKQIANPTISAITKSLGAQTRIVEGSLPKSLVPPVIKDIALDNGLSERASSINRAAQENGPAAKR